MQTYFQKAVRTSSAALVLAATALLAAPASAGILGLSLSIGEPDFYGRIDIGDAPAPRMIYREPVLVNRIAVQSAPIYLRVRAGYANDWEHHCHEYNACGRRVYFVQDDWYRDEYAPHYRQRQGHHNKGHGRGHRNGHRNGHRKGHGNGHGNGQ